MTHPLIQLLEKEKMQQSEKISAVFNQLRSGEAVKVTFGAASAKGKRQSFQGICIAINRRGISSSFILRNFLSGEGIEYTFFPYSTMICDLQLLSDSRAKVNYRRAKLYYLRDRTPKESSI